jgi:hypothetical protein
MNSILNFLDQIWVSFYGLLTSTHLQMLLLVGSGILAVGLLVLALTRWGHSRPVWKCVMLSVMAHILLMGYAYGTRLMVPPTPQEVVKEVEPMRINLVEDKPAIEEELKSLEEKKPWNEFVNKQPLPKMMETLDRPTIETEFVIKSASATSADFRPDMKTVDTPFAIKSPPMSLLKPLEFQPAEQLDQESLPDLSGKPEKLEFHDVKAQPIGMARAKQQDADVPAPQFSDVDDSQPFRDSALAAEDNEFTPVENRPRQDFHGEFYDPKSPLPMSKAHASSAATPKPSSRAIKVTNVKSTLKVSHSPRRLADGKPLPKIYALRNAPDRAAVLRQRGGSIETEQSVDGALLWLANHQENDGHWDPRKHGGGQEDKVFGHNRDGAGGNSETGVTGLSLLAFLAGGHSHLEGPYQGNIQAAIDFLIAQQDENGSLAGDARLFARMYCHSMALLALSEALAMTGDEKLLRAVQRGVDYSVRSQSVKDGGWRYQPGDDGDMSQFGWQALALHSAQMGGAVVPQKTIQNMHGFIDRCASGAANGLASYRPGQGPNTTMTAESLVSRIILGQDVPKQTKLEATRRIARELPSPYHVNLYYWYYGTLAMYFTGGSEWDEWNEAMKSALVTTQVSSGDQRGSWEPIGLWGGYGGRAYATAMSALTLQVYYRYSPKVEGVRNTEQFATQPVDRR